MVLLHGSPAVITLRDVNMYVPDMSNTAEVQWPSTAIFNKAPCVDDIYEGAELILVECGTWNVYTAAMHGARVMLSGNGVHSTEPVSGGRTVPAVVVLPTRRKRTSMQ